MISYTFLFDEQTEMVFQVDERGESPQDPVEALIPDWVRLDRHRCGECPLPLGSRRTCPAALAIRPVVEACDRRLSHETVSLIVEREGVTLQARVRIENAIRSLVGLLLPLSTCPVLMQLRPMAYFHLPLGGEEHTAFRFIGMYFITQHLRRQAGCEPDWELKGLSELLRKIHSVNRALVDRIRAASSEDATVNSLVLLDAMAGVVDWSIAQSLSMLKPFFTVCLPEEKMR